ncbi:hypothetical protein D9758_015610 [Tetrapyrgos nigripes]|uniref:KOW domain-containing protein n=1 Tax=Tetrapyrgos nigripes TaxID=182062 RepID=A0A8H5CKZ2_9AGAR|nr:hypothetical protein D9758_015610 [Tetrapyrgos nigripes]
MNIGRTPWIGQHVYVVKGSEKGYRGIVRDVRPFPNYSGLQLRVELQKFGIQVCPSINLDYDHVRHVDHFQPLDDIDPLRHYHEGYSLRPGYCCMPCEVPYSPECWPAPINVPRSTTPIPSDVNVDSLNTAAAPWTPDQYDSQPEITHWILNPRLNGLTLEVSLLEPKAKAWVHVSDGAIFNTHRPCLGVVPANICGPLQWPSAHTEQGLMVIIVGEHTGLLVRRVYYCVVGGESHFIVHGVDFTGSDWQERMTNTQLVLHPSWLIRVMESKADKERGKKVFEAI